MNNRPTDVLDMDYINSLPQPLFWLDGAWVWPVNDFEVETGLFRIDVLGKLEVKHIGEALKFRDADGNVHPVGDLYLDRDSWETRTDRESGQ